MGSSDQLIRDKTAKLIRAARKLRGLKQAEMANLLGITQGMISKLESAKLIPDAGLWYLLCKKLSINADLTYSSGYLFTGQAKSISLKNQFKVGQFNSPNKLRVKECIPFINSINDFKLQAEFNKELKAQGVDPDVFVVPEYLISIDLLNFIFKFLTNRFSESDVLEITKNNFLTNLDLISYGKDNSLKKFIQVLKSIESIFQYEVFDNSIKVGLNSNFDFNLENEAFLNSYLLYKVELLKQACEKKYAYKIVSIDRQESFNYVIQYAV